MNHRPIKDTKFNRYVGRNKKVIKKILQAFLIFFILNFVLFTIDIYTDGTTFFFHWPLAVTFVIFAVYVIRTISWAKRHSAPKVK